ncbi:MAG: PEGA domain-containing protein [Pseudomonadales bacterium]|nr:PEGA domain-containing protein [Candidatus Woesebacteria bacterium]MCB9801895.1 PEGA domain-containing protein [Pseudomonadales bacterium]
MKRRINHRVIYTVFSGLIIFLGTLIAIQYAQGKFRSFDENITQGSALLAANSFPTGAEVYVDGTLTTATDDTLYLTPGTYNVEIKKEGYNTWKKQLLLESELVTQTNATLFPISPNLTALTFTGISSLSPSPDGLKIAYYNASASSELKKGIYVLELSDNPLGFQKGAKQVAVDVPEYELGQANYIWSPDSTELLVQTPVKTMLLDISKTNELRTLPDQELRLSTLLSTWEEEMYLREVEYLREFPPEIRQIATQSATNTYISPDKKRLLYTAKESLTIPESLVTAPPSINSQQQTRTLTPETIYVYDREEDTNFMVGAASPSADTTEKVFLSATARPTLLTSVASPSAFATLQATAAAQTAQQFAAYHTSVAVDTLQWFPDSKHLIYIKDAAINIINYDGTNQTVLYSGPFENNFLYPWPDGSRVVIATVLSLDAPVNLYAVEIR